MAGLSCVKLYGRVFEKYWMHGATIHGIWSGLGHGSTSEWLGPRHWELNLLLPMSDKAEHAINLQ